MKEHFETSETTKSQGISPLLNWFITCQKVKMVPVIISLLFEAIYAKKETQERNNRQLPPKDRKDHVVEKYAQHSYIAWYPYMVFSKEENN